jgi:hypothetical protein
MSSADLPVTHLVPRIDSQETEVGAVRGDEKSSDRRSVQASKPDASAVVCQPDKHGSME